MVLAHAGHAQLLRLLRTLRQGSPAAAIVLHYDAKGEPPAQSSLHDLGVLMVAPRIRVRWGDASQVDAMLAALEFTTNHIDFEWLTFISGQDYPLRPVGLIEAELRGSDYDAYVRAGPAGVYANRYEFRYWNLPRFRHAYLMPEVVRSSVAGLRRRLNAAQRLFQIEGRVRDAPARLGLRAASAPFGRDFVCCKGSQWMTLNRRAAQRVLQFHRERPEVLRYYRRTLVPDESYLQTVICNDPELRVKDDHRRFIVWDDHRLAHPATLTMHHLPAMLASGKDFARKFDPSVDAEVLDALDGLLGGTSGIAALPLVAGSAAA